MFDDNLQNILDRLCHNLILINDRRWSLLIAHHCSETRNWLLSEIEFMEKKAKTMATYPTVRNSN